MYVIKNLPFQNVAASSVASLSLELGHTYHKILLKLGGTTFTKALITRIAGKLNGKIFYDVTGTQLDDINTYRNLNVDADYLMIDFTEPRAKSLYGQYIGALGTASGVSSLTLEITIGAATAPTLESYSLCSPGQELKLITGFIPYPLNFGAAGKFGIELPHGPQNAFLLKRVHFFGSILTDMEVKRNGVVIWENMLPAVFEFFAEGYEKTKQTDHYVVDFVMNNDMSQVVNTAKAQTLQFYPTVSGAGVLNVIYEVHGFIDKF